MFVGSAPDRGRRPGLAFASSPATTPRREGDYLGTVTAYSGGVPGGEGVRRALYAVGTRRRPGRSGPAPTRFVPPEGHVMGVYARTELERGIWKAPAGLRGQPPRRARRSAAQFTDAEHTELVENGFVNGIRPHARRRHHRRSVANAQHGHALVVRERPPALQLRQELAPRRPALRPAGAALGGAAAQRRVQRRHAVPARALAAGAFGTDPPDQVFTVKCDAENNPPEEVDLGNFHVEVYFYPVRPAETVVIVVGQQPSGGSAREA